VCGVCVCVWCVCVLCVCVAWLCVCACGVRVASICVHKCNAIRYTLYAIRYTRACDAMRSSLFIASTNALFASVCAHIYSAYVSVRFPANTNVATP